MNYLAHIYLSGESEEVVLGNFIGDYIKGQKFLDYSPQVAKGITLHRQIDTFTDTHPIIRECIVKLRPAFGKYAGIVVDIFLDHFLAVNWHTYSLEKLPSFTKRFHAIILANFFQLPAPVKLFVPFLIQHKRLQSYGSLEGIEKTLQIMAKHTSLPAQTEFALRILKDDYHFYNSAFNSFFPEIIEFIEFLGEYKIVRPELKPVLVNY